MHDISDYNEICQYAYNKCRNERKIITHPNDGCKHIHQSHADNKQIEQMCQNNANGISDRRTCAESPTYGKNIVDNKTVTYPPTRAI